MNESRVVVAGIDGSEGSVEVLRFALEEGLRRGAAVDVVTAWTFESPTPGFGSPRTHDDAKREVQRRQDAVVRQALDEAVGAPPVAQLLLEGHAPTVLLKAARKAEVLVVGHHRRRFLARAPLGSTATSCMRHATRPVVVVPTGITPEDERDEALVPTAETTG